MFKQYLKLTINKKSFFSFAKLNIFPSILEVIIFFILPILIRRFYIIEQYEAIAINLSFLFLFEASIVFASRGSLNICSLNTHEEKQHNMSIFSKALLFAFIKTTFFLSFLYLLKKTTNPHLAFLLCFLSMFFFLCMFWLPSLLVKNNLIPSLKKSIHLYFFHPFFTTFIFLHSIILFFISIILLNVYPGPSKIMYNMHIALQIIEEKVNE